MRKFFRTLLEKERDEAKDGLVEQDSILQESSAAGVSVNDEDWESRQEVEALTEKIYDRDFRLIAKIEAAIRRVDSGDFGYCSVESCRLEIGVERLLARPTAERCIECKRAQEWRERQGD